VTRTSVLFSPSSLDIRWRSATDGRCKLLSPPAATTTINRHRFRSMPSVPRGCSSLIPVSASIAEWIQRPVPLDEQENEPGNFSATRTASRPSGVRATQWRFRPWAAHRPMYEETLRHDAVSHQGIRFFCPIDGCGRSVGRKRDLPRHLSLVHKVGTPRGDARSAQLARHQTRPVTSSQTPEPFPLRDPPPPEPRTREGVADQPQPSMEPSQTSGQCGNLAQGVVTNQPQCSYYVNPCQALVESGSSAEGGVANPYPSQFSYHTNTPQAPFQGESLVVANPKDSPASSGYGLETEYLYDCWGT